MQLSETRKMLIPFSEIVLKTMDVNQVAANVGGAAEHILMGFYGWKKKGKIGNEKGYDAVDQQGNKIEIKGMSNESKNNYVAYSHEGKGGKYDFLTILHFNEKRVATIPIYEIENFISENKLPGRKTKSLRLNFNDPLLTKLGKPRKKSLFQALFLKYEDKKFTF